MHITLPQERQFGAAPCRGCLVATQLHFLDLELSNVGFVEISSARIAASRSDMAVEAPAMGMPPAIEILVVVAAGFGVELREAGVDFDFDLGGPSPSM
jgi:hypothetical protein